VTKKNSIVATEAEAKKPAIIPIHQGPTTAMKFLSFALSLRTEKAPQIVQQGDAVNPLVIECKH